MTLFVTNYHVLVFRWTFQQKVAESGSIREKARKIIDLAKSLELLEQTTMSLHFDQLFRKKLQKVPHFVKKDGKSSIWPKLCNFSNKLPCLCISMKFSEKSCKKCSFREEEREFIDLARTGNFSSKLPCLGIFMNFSERSCKKCLISWESTRNNPFHQNLQLFEKTTMFGWTLWQKVAKTASFREKARKLMDLAETMQLFRTNYHVLVFRWTVEEKFAKSCSIREKARKIIDLAKTVQVSEQTAMSLHFDELFRKKLQKMPHFVKKHEKSSIWPKLCNFSNKLPCVCISINFSGKSCRKCLILWKSTKNHRFGQIFGTSRTNYHVFAFRSTFQEKVAKSASFREKGREIIDLAKSLELFEQTTMSLHFDQLFRKKCKKCLISTRRTRIHRFGQNWQLFEETTMSWHFHELFRKKLQKVPHSVEKHENSSIWPKLWHFL